MHNVEVIDCTGQPVERIETNAKYCISDEQHELQVRHCLKRGLPGLEINRALIHEPVAVVCFGPSLNDTWPMLKDFRVIVSMSGSYDFLRERGIEPNYHVECDPRPHKIAFHSKPSENVVYLLASCVSPAVFDALDGQHVRVWHVLGKESVAELPTIYPHGQWVLTGGGNVGLRTMVVLRTMGFVNQHIFGMDYSFGADGLTPHAGAHTNDRHKKMLKVGPVGAEYYYSSHVMVEYAKQFFHEVKKLPDVNFTLYGRGLLQNMAKNKLSAPMSVEEVMARTPVISGPAVVALSTRPVISPEYAALNRQLHDERIDYGVSGAKRVAVVERLIGSLQARTVLDYGCGKGYLARKLASPIWEYDPAIPGKDTPPRPAELVICSDVLEHVEPQYLDGVLADLARVTLKVGYFVIHMGPAGKTLPDGRNAHLIQKPKEWWETKVSRYFDIAKALSVNGYELHIVVSPRKRSLSTVEVVKSQAA